MSMDHPFRRGPVVLGTAGNDVSAAGPKRLGNRLHGVGGFPTRIDVCRDSPEIRSGGNGAFVVSRLTS